MAKDRLAELEALVKVLQEQLAAKKGPALERNILPTVSGNSCTLAIDLAKTLSVWKRGNGATVARTGFRDKDGKGGWMPIAEDAGHVYLLRGEVIRVPRKAQVTY